MASIRDFIRRSGSLLVVIIIAFVWLAVGVTLLAIGSWKVATVDTGEEVWGINVISPGIGCLIMGMMLVVLLLYDCIRGRTSKPRYAKRKKGHYQPPQFHHVSDAGAEPLLSPSP